MEMKSYLWGAVITGTVLLISKWVDHLNNLKIKRLVIAIEVEKKHLIEPVVLFIEKQLESMQRTSAQGLDRENRVLNNEYIFNLAATQARIKGLGDDVLNKKFDEFFTERIYIATFVAEQKIIRANEHLEKAIKLAGEILELLFKKLKKIR